MHNARLASCGRLIMHYALCIVNYALFFCLSLYDGAEGYVFEFGVTFCVGPEGFGLAIVLDGDFRALYDVVFLVNYLETHIVRLRWRRRGCTGTHADLFGK